MNIIDKLLSTDVEKLKEGYKKQYEIKRLSEKIGVPFIVDCYPLTADQTQHLMEVSNGKIADIKLNAIVEACKIEGKPFTNAALMEKFNCLTGKELVESLFLVGEISVLYDVVNDISGYGKDCVAEIKNS